MSSIKFCPICHKEAYRIRENGDSIEVVQGTMTIIKVNRESTVSMAISCPSGHSVPLRIGQKIKD